MFPGPLSAGKRNEGVDDPGYKDFDWSLMKQNKLWRMKVIEKFEKYFFLQMEYTTQLFVSKNFIGTCWQTTYVTYVVISK